MNKVLLVLLIVGFMGFSHDYREKWVAHAKIVSSLEDLCIVTVIKAETQEEAEIKFQKWINKKEREYGCLEDKKLRAMKKLKDAIMIEP